jgi:hypothetical protein
MLMTKEYWLEEKKKENYHTRSLCVWIFANPFLIRLGFPFHVRTLTERLKQTFMSMINIMLKNVDLNDKWWIELIKTINYLRNRFLMTNRSIIFYEIDTKKKIISRSSSSNRDNELRYETQINHEMKKTCLQIVFDCARKVREESHLSNAASQRNHLSCFVCYLNQEKARKIISRWDFKWNISKKISHWINRIFDEKTSLWVKFDNHSYLFVSIQSSHRRFTLLDSLNRKS